MMSRIQNCIRRMINVQPHRLISEQMAKINSHMGQLEECHSTIIKFFNRVQYLYCQFARRGHENLIAFEKSIVKGCFYVGDKSSLISTFSNVIRQFYRSLERNAQFNLLHLKNLEQTEIKENQKKLENKRTFFMKEFHENAKLEVELNKNYGSYSKICQKLSATILKFKSYSQPIFFYNQSLTKEYLLELENTHRSCSAAEGAAITDLQVINQKRKSLSYHIKDLNQTYAHLLYTHVRLMAETFARVVDIRKEQFPKEGPRRQDSESDEVHQSELKRLNVMYAGVDGNDNLLEDFQELFSKDAARSEISWDHKLFYERCDRVRTQKIKRAEETLHLQTILLMELLQQMKQSVELERAYRDIEKDVFGNNGIESFRKKFRLLFGLNMDSIKELCFSLMERPKKSLERLEKSTENRNESLSKIIEMKKDSLETFMKRSKSFLDEHLKIKAATEGKKEVEIVILQKFKNSVHGTFDGLKKAFEEFNALEKQMDIRFFDFVKGHADLVAKESMSNVLNHMIEKEKNRLANFTSLSVESEIVLILKEDIFYEILMNEGTKFNQDTVFLSKIDRVQYQKTQRVLERKETRMKSMFRQRLSCCGIKTEPIKHQVLSSHSCTLQKEKISGYLNVLAVGLTFEESSMNPFASKLQLMIPQDDIKSYSGQDKELEILTEMGALQFNSEACTEIIASIQKHTQVKNEYPVDKKEKAADSTSLIKHKTFTEMRISFEKNQSTLSERMGSRIKDKKRPQKQHYFQQIAMRCNEQSLFSKEFSLVDKDGKDVKQHRLPSDTCCKYLYNDQDCKLYVRERRSCSILNNILLINYKWKVSFPETPMLHSFTHSEHIKVKIESKQLGKINIQQEMHQTERLFLKEKFYREISKVNEKIGEIVKGVLERDVLITHDYQEDSISFEEGTFTDSAVFSKLKLSKNENSSLLNRLKSFEQTK